MPERQLRGRYIGLDRADAPGVPEEQPSAWMRQCGMRYTSVFYF
jgi:hypothetical protein